MSFLPIMLSISVFLLLAGWKGVRGGLSQLIYHIKYQPSSTFSLPVFLIPPFTRLSLLSLFSLLPFLHLLPFTSLFLTCSLCFFSTCFSPFPLHALCHSLTLLPLSPPALFWRFPSLSLFFLTTAICLCTPTSHLSNVTFGPYLSRFPFLFIHTDMHSPPIMSNWVWFAEVQYAWWYKRTQSCKKISLPITTMASDSAAH